MVDFWAEVEKHKGSLEPCVAVKMMRLCQEGIALKGMPTDLIWNDLIIKISDNHVL